MQHKCKTVHLQSREGAKERLEKQQIREKKKFYLPKNRG